MNHNIHRRYYFGLIIFLCLLSALFVPSCDVASDKTWSGTELGGTASDQARLFDYRQIVLANGLRVITQEDFSCPIVAVQLWYHVGSKNEQPDRQGFAHMFEHMMFRGTDRLGPTDHFDLIRRTGGASNGYTSFDRTVYFQTLPADQLELALWLEAERMTFLNITQANFETERKVVEEERRIQLNQPYGTVDEKLVAELFKVHPYRWMPIGNIAHLRAASVKELREFWTRCYVPNNAVLIIVGAVEHEEAQRQAQRYFGWIPAYEEPPKVSVTEPLPAAPRSVTIKNENAPAAVVGIIWRTVPVSRKDSVVLQMLAGILGGGNSSRVYRELVAEKQLAVGAEAISWSLEQDGVFGAGALLPPFGADANQVLNIIQAQVERLGGEPVTQRELTKARNQMLKELVTRNLAINSKASMLGKAAVMEHDTSRVNRKLAEIRSIGTDDLQRVARTYLSSRRAVIVVVERNLAGVLMPAKRVEERAPVMGEPEKQAPPPGRAGLVRPDDFPKSPPVAKLKAFKHTPKYESATLPNGLKVLVVPNHEVSFVTVQLGLLAGCWAETKPGTASMTLKMLTKGTKNYSEAQLADELETYAISLDGSAQMDSSVVTTGCLAEHIERAMGLLAEVVLRPSFPAQEFEKLRKQVITSLTIASAEPDYIADKEFRRRLFGPHPYSRTPKGEITDVQALKADDLENWWRTFARPDMAVLIFAGDIEQERAVALAKEALGGWRSVSEKPDVAIAPIPKLGGTHIYLVDRPGSSQSQIRIGGLGITRHYPDYFVSRLVSSYFGGGFNSRLNASVRVKKGLTYSIWAGFIPSRFAGRFEVTTFSKTETTVEAVRAALDEIEALKSRPPSQDELEHNRSYILGSFVRHRETPQDIADDLWLIESQQLDSDYLDRFLAGVAKASEADCTRFTDESIDGSKLVVVVVGEAEKLKAELEKIAPVTIVAAQKRPEPEPKAEN